MAHIPYGYRIRGGRAEPVPEDMERVRIFIELYLSGLSIDKANEAAQIPLSATSLRHLLKNRIYLGDDYYPPMIDEELFDQVAEEMEKRTHPGSRAPAKGQQVRQSFIMKPLRKQSGGLNAEKMAAYVYSLITPSPDGRTAMTEKDLKKVITWRTGQKHQSG